MNLAKFLPRGDSVKCNLRNEPFHRDLTRKPWVYNGNILNLFVLHCMDFSQENISALSLHRTPKFSASVNISLASPVHCLLIIPISLLPSKELSCGNKISLQKSNTYLNTIQKPLQTWSMDIVTLSPLPFSLSNHTRLQNKQYSTHREFNIRSTTARAARPIDYHDRLPLCILNFQFGFPPCPPMVTKSNHEL